MACLQEYVEPEDVFDINPRQKDSGAASNGQADADMDDAEIDIVTEDEVHTFLHYGRYRPFPWRPLSTRGGASSCAVLPL